jgi:hypothetical protein
MSSFSTFLIFPYFLFYVFLLSTCGQLVRSSTGSVNMAAATWLCATVYLFIYFVWRVTTQVLPMLSHASKCCLEGFSSKTTLIVLHQAELRALSLNPIQIFTWYLWTLIKLLGGVTQTWIYGLAPAKCPFEGLFLIKNYMSEHFY